MTCSSSCTSTSDLGLSPVSRSRVSTTPPLLPAYGGPGSKFEGLLGGRDWARDPAEAYFR
jgi:hypothetical protein